jgi:hypothetical protein
MPDVQARIADLKRIAADPQVPVEQRVDAVRRISRKCQDGGKWLEEFSKTDGLAPTVATAARKYAAIHLAASLISAVKKTPRYKRNRSRIRRHLGF